MQHLSDAECRAVLSILWERSITGLALVAEDGRFLAANSTYCRLVEFTEAELKQKRFQDITDPDDLRADVEMSREVRAGASNGYDMFKAYYTKTKRNLPVMLRVTGLWMSGTFIYFVAEVAPLDKPPSPAPRRAPSVRLLPLVKDYWTQILFVVGLLAAVAERVISNKP